MNSNDTTSRDRIITIIMLTDTAIRLEPDSGETLVDLVCQYGKSMDLTPEEFNRVWDMTVGEVFSFLPEGDNPG